MFVFQMESADPCRNLALEEYILRSRQDGDYLLLWQNAHTIVVGRHQNTAEEINAEFVHKQGIQVVRRITGGGAVYHDRGNLNFSFITNAEDAVQMTFEHFTRPVVLALRQLGLDAEASGRNDIVANGHKISGNAQAMHQNRILHHGTLLFDVDLSVLAQALRVKPEKLQSKSVKSVRSRVANIRDLLPQAMCMDEFKVHLLNVFTQQRDCSALRLSGSDRAAIEDLQEKKYRTWEWTYGKSPQFAVHNCRKYAGGFLDIHLNIQKGRIQDSVFYGDYMALRPSVEVSEALKGCPYGVSGVQNCLRSLPLAQYFGSISLEEILECMFF